MSYSINFQKLYKIGMIILILLLSVIVVMNTLSGTPSSSDSPLTTILFNCQISGIIKEAATSMPLQDTKITLLDPATLAVLITDIYTDASGVYDATVEVSTNITDPTQFLPTHYWVSEAYPNPVSASESFSITIQYDAPGTSNLVPKLELYNILGKQVDYNVRLAGGVYLFRLNFDDEYITNTKKVVITSSGKLDFTLRQRTITSESFTNKTALYNNLSHAASERF